MRFEVLKDGEFVMATNDPESAAYSYARTIENVQKEHEKESGNYKTTIQMNDNQEKTFLKITYEYGEIGINDGSLKDSKESAETTQGS